jgi:PST family polysaccharide transporter
VAFGLGRSRAAAARQALYAALVIIGALLGVQFGPIGVALSVSIAVWIFYFVSLTYALSLVIQEPLAVIWVHVRALLLALLVDAVDFEVSQLFDARQFWLAEAAGCVAAIAAVGIVGVFAPDAWLGAPLLLIRQRIARYASGLVVSAQRARPRS